MDRDEGDEWGRVRGRAGAPGAGIWILGAVQDMLDTGMKAFQSGDGGQQDAER